METAATGPVAAPAGISPPHGRRSGKRRRSADRRNIVRHCCLLLQVETRCRKELRRQEISCQQKRRTEEQLRYCGEERQPEELRAGRQRRAADKHQAKIRRMVERRMAEERQKEGLAARSRAPGRHEPKQRAQVWEE